MLGYISVKDSIKRLKKSYVGVKSNKIIEKEGYVKVTGNNITDYFETSKAGYSYTFKDSNNDGIFIAENIGIHGSNAFIKLTAKRDIKTLSFNYLSRSEAGNYDYLEIIHKGTRVVYQTGSNFTESTYTATDVKEGEVFTFRYRKDGSVHADPEYAQFSNFQVWDKVKSADGELGDYAKRIYKIYVGSKDNKAKLMYEEGKIWHKRLNTFSLPSLKIGGTRLKSHALLLGNGTTYTLIGDTPVPTGSGYIDSYSKSLTYKRISTRSPRSYTGTTTMNDTAFFGFGKGFSENKLNTVLAIQGDDFTSKMLTPPDVSTRSNVAAATSDNMYAVFAGGATESNTSVSDVIAIDVNHTCTKGPELSASTTDMIGCTFNNNAVFCGGYRRHASNSVADPYKYVYIYDKDLSKTTINMLKARMSHTSNSLGEFLVITGGRYNWNSGNNLAPLEVITKDFTRSELTLKQGRYAHASVVIDNLLILSGGRYSTSSGTELNSIEIFDENLTKVEYDLTLNNPKCSHTGVSFDNIGIFAGGVSGSSTLTDVECFII